MFASIFAILMFIAAGYSIGSVRIIKEGNAALVERLGRYRGTLEPGLNFIVPVLDSVVSKTPYASKHSIFRHSEPSLKTTLTSK